MARTNPMTDSAVVIGGAAPGPPRLHLVESSDEQMRELRAARAEYA